MYWAKNQTYNSLIDHMVVELMYFFPRIINYAISLYISLAPKFSKTNGMRY